MFVSPEGAALVEKNDHAFDTLMYAKDHEAWKEHLGADDGLLRFLQAGKPLPVADWISPAELEMHNRILKGGYTGVFNWYKALTRVDPAPEDVDLTAEDKTIEVPVLQIVTEKDYATIPDMQLQFTKDVAADLTAERLSCGHWAMLEERDRVEKLLEDFATSRGL